MPAKYLLYIDILGFSDLVRKRGAVKKLYETINKLNVHRHYAFKTIAFSDTLLVYNIVNPDAGRDRKYLVMYLCEFAQDLFYRLIGRDLHFRAYLTQGDFKINEFENLKAFYGEALIDAYEREKGIECTGLFIDNNLLDDCDIFYYDKYDDACSYVHLMQSLDGITFPDNSTYPVDPILVFETDASWSLAHDFAYLRNIYRHMNNTDLPPRVRTKHATAWNMIRRRHKRLVDTLEAHDLRPAGDLQGRLVRRGQPRFRRDWPIETVVAGCRAHVLRLQQTER
jgi:hypothetical protein